MVPLKIASNVSRFKPALNLNWVLADLSRGSNSLISDSDLYKFFSDQGWMIDSLMFKMKIDNLHLWFLGKWDNVKFWQLYFQRVSVAETRRIEVRKNNYVSKWNIFTPDFFIRLRCIFKNIWKKIDFFKIVKSIRPCLLLVFFFGVGRRVVDSGRQNTRRLCRYAKVTI